MRITDRRGVSWRDPVHPGVRHWRSRSVSYWLPWPLAVLGWLFWLGFGWWLWLGLQLWIYVTCLLAAVLWWLLAGRGPFHVEHHRHLGFWWPTWRRP